MEQKLRAEHADEMEYILFDVAAAVQTHSKYVH